MLIGDGIEESVNSEYKEYFIITDKNYYIFNSSDGTIYKYNNQNKSLDFFLKVTTCDIDYFYEK